MNYEELIESNEAAQSHNVRLPLGGFGKYKIDNKYVNHVVFRPELLGNLYFASDVRKETETNNALSDKHQLRVTEDKHGEMITGWFVENGSYQSVEQLINSNPAIVASDNFIFNMLQQLVEALDTIHNEGFFQLCLAPSTIFVRKGDERVMLLTHGSFYRNIDPADFYEDFEDYVAPEVLAKGTIDERSDVYALGKFLEYLVSITNVSYEYKKVIAKATSDIVEDRYATPERMLSALRSTHRVRRTLFISASILVAVLIGLFAYFDLTPRPLNVEFVKPVPTISDKEDYLDKGFDPKTELGVITDDTVGKLTPQQEAAKRAQFLKCKQIFRRQYSKEAEHILSKIYNKTYMSLSEKNFMAKSEQITQELIKLQVELGAKAGIDNTTSQTIATEIINKITEQKKAQLGVDNPLIKK